MSKAFTNITWARLQPGYKLIALRPPHYQQVLYLINEHYLSSDLITAATRMFEDETSVERLLERVLTLLDDDRSIVLIEERTQNVVAVLVMSTVTKNSFHRVHSREDVRNGCAYNKYIELKTALNKRADVFIDYNCDIFMRFYLLCIHGDYLNTNFGYNLFRCGMEVCRALHVPIACGIFPNPEMQKCAQLVGFEIAHKIDYTEWGCDMVDCGEGEPLTDCGCCMMVAKVPPPDVVPAIMTQAEKPKKAKKDKKKEKGKKKKK